MFDHPNHRIIPVQLGTRAYPIVISQSQNSDIGEFARTCLDATWAGRGCRDSVIVTDSNVLPLTDPWRRVLESLGLSIETAVIEPGEESKSLAQAAALYTRLIEMRADRHTLVVAIGGGVVGDLAGFVAATFTRGLNLLMVPTSLLAQVDSSVGGKVGINHPAAKNIVGAFHQPIGVWIDLHALATLPGRELRSGLAEVIKYGVILDPNFFDLIERRLDEALALDSSVLGDFIARSCVLKADVVSRDEREETGLRAVLNFGHTIGHAIEAVAGYGGDYLHGEAVAVGMIAESRLAERLGWIDHTLTDRLTRLVERAGLPTKAPKLDVDALLAAMALDKKNQGGRLKFVLPRELGRVELVTLPDTTQLRAVLNDLIQ
jgi:3-dehydroquinate synthase